MKILSLFIPLLALAQPLPPASAELRALIQLRQQLGKPLDHYTMPVTVTVTQTVTMVYELDYMRYIRTKASTSGVVTMKTNFVLLETNFISSVTNSSPVTPR